MDAELSIKFNEFVDREDYAGAEVFLNKMREEAEASGDTEFLNSVLTLTGQLYMFMEPPHVERAEHAYLERERNMDTAYNILQTAMFYYYEKADAAACKEKALAASRRAKEENDDRVLYSALGLLGQTHIDLGEKEQATHVLREIHRLVIARRRFTIGDEVRFLERAKLAGIGVSEIRSIASDLAQHCPDTDFAEQLRKLSE